MSNLLLHYAIVGLTVGINSLAGGIGEGITGHASLRAADLQPRARGEIIKTAIFGMALIETASVLSMAIAIMLLFGTKNHVSIYPTIAEIGIALAVCLSGFITGLASALPARAAVLAVARQPFFSPKILRFMLLTQTIIQTPIIFSFLVAIIIKNQSAGVTDVTNAIRLVASGLCIGLGGIGPALGLGFFGKAVIESLSSNRQAYQKLFSFTIISEAIIETPAIFAMITSIVLLSTSVDSENMLKSSTYLAAGLATGISTIGPGISSGITAAAACRQIALNLNHYTALSRLSMFGQTLIDTSAIYGLLISLGLIFFT